MTSCLASSVDCDLKEGTTSYSFLFPKHPAQCLYIMGAKYFGEERNKKDRKEKRRERDNNCICSYLDVSVKRNA